MAGKAMSKVNDTTVENKLNKTTKTYGNNDPILCKSLVNGNLFITGARSGIPYTWADYNDVCEVEYQDIIYMIRSNDKAIFQPRIIILDEDIVAQNKNLTNLYDNLYSVGDLRDILALRPNEMKKAIESLPEGAKNSIKGIASSMIEDGFLDSVQKIKVIDDIFNTKLLFALAQD